MKRGEIQVVPAGCQNISLRAFRSLKHSNEKHGIALSRLLMPQRIAIEEGRMDPVDVLIVEDEALTGFDLRIALDEAGLSVVNALSVSSALALIDARHVRSALLDANLSGIAADDVAAALAARGVPYAIVSGRRPERQPMWTNAAAVVAKPYDRALLVNLVARLVEQASRRRGS